jgi:hypothetical protein
VIVTRGNGFTVIEVRDDVAEHPFASVIVTVRVPVLFTLIDCVVCPLPHK